MSKNKFWNKQEAKAGLDEITKIGQDMEELEPIEVEGTTESHIDTSDLNHHEEEMRIGNSQFSYEEGIGFGINEVLDILYNYPKNMFDDTYSVDTKLVADWLKIILKRKGYNV